MDVQTLCDGAPGGADIEPSRQDYLAGLWRMQLNIPHIGVHDDFFEAGGSSMQVIEMLMTVAEKFDKEIDFAEFFKNPCILRLDELIAS